MPRRQIVWSAPAKKDLDRLDFTTAERVYRAVERYADTGRGQVKRLKNYSHEWRLRVGNWRVRFTDIPASNEIRIIRVLPRDKAYRD